MGLLELMYPIHSYNVTDDSFYIIIGWIGNDDPSPTKHILKQGMYSHRSDIIQGLRVAQRSVRNRFVPPMTPLVFRTFTQNRFSVKNVGHEKIRYFHFSESLALLMGFSSEKIYTGTYEHRSLLASDLLLNTRNMFIYCDLVERSYVGDTSAPLLRVVKRAERPGEETTYVNFNPIQYLPLLKKSFDTISIKMCTDDGRVMPFTHGKSILVLHFRRSINSNLLL